MKRIIFLTVIAVFVSLASQAQVVVKVRPVAPVVVKPACPAPGHVWVSGSWKWNKKTRNYVWVDGHWVKPHRLGAGWIDGHWRTTRGGWKYIPGHWS